MADEPRAHVALLMIDLMIPFSDSLKAKRRVVKGLKDRMGSKFNASIAEIACLEEWQRSVIGVAMVSNDRGHLERSLGAVARFVEEIGDIHLLGTKLEWL